MRALLDGEDESRVGNYWIGSAGYPLHGDDQLIHRTIASWILGRPLTRKEQVHHINKNRLDNRRCNLYICKDQHEHLKIHRELDAAEAGVSLDTHSYCSYHKRYELKENFSTNRATWSGLHNNCREATNEYRRIRGYGKDKFDWRARLNQQYRRAMKQNTNISWVSQEGRRP